MNPHSMPAELVELEDRLRGRAGEEPGAGLRDRVLRAVAEAAAPAQSSVAGWHWAAIAAGVLVVMNLSMISASQTEFSLGPASGLNQMAAELAALRQTEARQEGIFK
jgi:hypothetical protein